MKANELNPNVNCGSGWCNHNDLTHYFNCSTVSKIEQDSTDLYEKLHPQDCQRCSCKD